MFHPNFRLSPRIVRVNHDNRRIGRARVNRVKNCIEVQKQFRSIIYRENGKIRKNAYISCPINFEKHNPLTFCFPSCSCNLLELCWLVASLKAAS